MTFYRYLTAQTYGDLANCNYIRNTEVNSTKTTSKRSSTNNANTTTKRMSINTTTSVPNKPSRLHMFLPPPISSLKTGSLRKMQLKNFQSAMDN